GVARLHRLALLGVSRVERRLVRVELETLGRLHRPYVASLAFVLEPFPAAPIVAQTEGAHMARRKPGEGQTALVTGASAGIGVDLAECFAKDGYDLILTARSEGALQEVANRLSAA